MLATSYGCHDFQNNYNNITQNYYLIIKKTTKVFSNYSI